MENKTENSASPNIAIVGAGIAGIALAIACRNLNLQYTVYESGPEIWQHGSGIGIAPNAIQALGLIDKSLPAALANVSNKDTDLSRGLYYRHGQTGESWSSFDIIEKVPFEGAQTVARSAFMNAMVPYVPAENIEFCKHLTAITELPSGQVQIHFKDGTSAVHDVVVGCDGIHSKTRTHILGKDDPDAEPRFTGKIVHRAVVSSADFRALVGDEVHEYDGVTVFVGRHAHIVLMPIDGGERYSITAAASRKSWTHGKSWVIDCSAKELRDDYLNFDERLIRLLEKAGNTDIWALFDLPFPRTFVRGNVVVLGDAAHASTPFQGSGTAMALEDVYMLSNLLAQTARPSSTASPNIDNPNSRTTLRSALQTYDAFRRPRTQKQVQTALEGGWLIDLESPIWGADLEAFRNVMPTRMHWLWHIDLEAELGKALAAARES